MPQISAPISQSYVHTWQIQRENTYCIRVCTLTNKHTFEYLWWIFTYTHMHTHSHAHVRTHTVSMTKYLMKCWIIVLLVKSKIHSLNNSFAWPCRPLSQGINSFTISTSTTCTYDQNLLLLKLVTIPMMFWWSKNAWHTSIMLIKLLLLTDQCYHMTQ